MIYQFSDDDWNNTKTVAPGEFVQLPAGGYVCKIVAAEFGESKQGNDMLILNVDIAEGDFAGYFQSTVDRFNQKNWSNAGIYRQLVYTNDKKLSPYFKGFIAIIEQSNFNFVARKNGGIDPKDLIGKLCGFVFIEEEYTKQDKSVGVRTVVRTPKTVAQIRKGGFKVPPLKKLDASKAPTTHKTNSYAPPQSSSPDVMIGNNNPSSPDLEDPPF